MIPHSGPFVNSSDQSSDQSLGQTFSWQVPAEGAGLRLDVWLTHCLTPVGISRERAKRLIKDGAVFLDDVPCLSPKTLLVKDSLLFVRVPQTRSRLAPEEGELCILYRDPALAVLNKPAGITVHPCPSCPEGTLAHRLVAHFPELESQEGFRPGIVHRLDKDTSGLLLVALNESSRLALATFFAERTVRKEYLALVQGVPQTPEGSIDAPIGRHPTRKVCMAVVPGGKPAQSSWRVLYANPDKSFSLLAVRIHTGRTHQIRVHLQYAGYPLLGDPLYGTSAQSIGQAHKTALAKRPMLHAWKLSLPHPTPKALPSAPPMLEFTCPPPPDFPATIRLLHSKTLPVVITGSPGCGKSTLLAVYQDLGIPSISADTLVQALYQPGADGWSLLRSRYGERFVPNPALPVNKKSLGQAMHESPSLRREINSLIHPLVAHAVTAFWAKATAEQHPLAVAEIPLFLETGFGTKTQSSTAPVLLGVHCPFDQRQKRLQERGWDTATIAAVESWQWPEEEKMRACDFVVNNIADKATLQAEALALHKALLHRRAKKAEDAVRQCQILWEVDG